MMLQRISEEEEAAVAEKSLLLKAEGIVRGGLMKFF